VGISEGEANLQEDQSTQYILKTGEGAAYGEVWIYQIGMDPDATSPSTEEKFLRYGRLRRMHFTDTE
jgi:hypothetical protein